MVISSLSNEILSDFITSSYAQMELKKTGMDFIAYKEGVIGLVNLKANKKVKKDILTVIDFAKASTQKRMWIIDLKNKKLLQNSLVAHGKNSGGNYADNFSNIPNSLMSSLGFYITSSTYQGKHGYSLRLDGVDKGVNDNARNRAIVMHGAKYVSEEFIKCNGRLGRSFGCPAVPQETHKSTINLVKDGTVIYIRNPKKVYRSVFLNEITAEKYFQLL